jgi:hypothetical protein
MSNEINVIAGDGAGFAIELERKGKIVRVTWKGEVTLAVLREGFSKTRQFATGRAIAGAISDFSHVHSIKLSSDDVYALTKEAPVFETEIPRITVSGKEHIFGMARMFELLSDDAGLHVVRTTEEAYSLLQLQNPEFEPIQIP